MNSSKEKKPKSETNNKNKDSTDETNQNEEKDIADETADLEQLNNLLQNVESPEELQKILDQLAGSPKNPNAPKNVKKIGFSNRIVSNFFLNMLIYLALNTLITFSIMGYIKVFDYTSIVYVIIFVISFSVLDTLIKELLFKKFPYIIIVTAGSIFLLIPIILVLLLQWVIPHFELHNVVNLIIYIVALLIIRLFFNNFINNRFRKYQFKKRKINK